MSRILVIDDEPHIRKIIHELLVLDGHEIDQAENGKVGLELIERHRYALIITDIVMPEQDGLEVIMELKRLYPSLRFIVMTGGGDRLDVNSLLKMATLMGAERVMPKPLDFEKLRVAVKEILDAE